MYRKSLVQTRSSEINRLQKVMEGANIKLTGTIKDITGKSGMALLNALLDGEDLTAERIQEMRATGDISGCLKASNEELAAALDGVITPAQKSLMRSINSHIRDLTKRVANIDQQIDDSMTAEQKAAVKRITKIPGIGPDSAKAIISVIGTDMSRFPTDKAFASWAGLCPGNNESAGKRHSGKTTSGNKLLRTTMILCARSAVKVKGSYYHAQYERIALRRGKNRAAVAVAHSMLRAMYHMLKDEVNYEDLGADFFNQFNPQRKINSLLKKLKSLGWNGNGYTAPEAKTAPAAETAPEATTVPALPVQPATTAPEATTVPALPVSPATTNPETTTTPALPVQSAATDPEVGLPTDIPAPSGAGDVQPAKSPRSKPTTGSKRTRKSKASGDTTGSAA